VLDRVVKLDFAPFKPINRETEEPTNRKSGCKASGQFPPDKGGLRGVLDRVVKHDFTLLKPINRETEEPTNRESGCWVQGV
jgi:hypothetical protein